ncbi:MAG: PhnD/SsuA/transferrin family substrate-binding protein [Gammaproteobacteria bacterium]
MIAALPMYDFPELQSAHDDLWSAVAGRLAAAGVRNVPRSLTRDLDHRAVWRHPELLLAQACEYPLAKSFDEHLIIVATPRYSAPGCVGILYKSAIVVRAEDPVGSLAGMRGRRCVVNELDSNSGMNLLRAALAPLAAGARFFDSVVVSGSHRRSLEMIAANDADVAAIDCVTFAHLQRIDLPLTRKIRVLGWTPPSPCLPLVTARTIGAGTLAKLRSALAAVFVDSALTPVRQRLLLDGIDLAPDATLSRVLKLERDAVELRYPHVH